VSFATTPQTIGDFAQVSELHVHPDFASSPSIVHDLGVLSDAVFQRTDAESGFITAFAPEPVAFGVAATALGAPAAAARRRV
jgi:hypothetical protein